MNANEDTVWVKRKKESGVTREAVTEDEDLVGTRYWENNVKRSRSLYL